MHQTTMRRQQGLHLSQGVTMRSTSTVHLYPSEVQASFDAQRSGCKPEPEHISDLHRTRTTWSLFWWDICGTSLDEVLA